MMRNTRRGLSFPTIWNIAVALSIFSFLLTMTAVTVADPDLWGHVRFGLDIFENRTIPQVDEYSYVTGDHRWINHEWLAELILAVAWSLGGSPALIAVKTGVLLLTFLIVYRHLRMMRVAPLRAAILIILLFSVLMPFLVAVRPYIFTALLFTLLLHLIVRAESGRYRSMWAAPFIMAVWANLHGGFLAGLAVLLLWSGMHSLLNRHAVTKLLPPILLSLLATLVNPYHVELLIFLLRTATVARPEITDWQPLEWNSLLGILYLSLLSLGFIALAVSHQRRKLDLLFILMIIAAMPFIALRHILLSAAGIIMLSGNHIDDLLARFAGPQDLKPKIAPWSLFLPVSISISLIVWQARSFTSITLIEDFYPVAAVKFLEQSGVQGNLAVHFPWGEYAIWHLQPKIKVAIDGRRETVYPEEVYRKYLQFQYGRGEWDAFLKDYPTDMVLVHKGYRIYELMSSNREWEPVFEDSISSLFVKNETPTQRLLQALPTAVSIGEDQIFP